VQAARAEWQANQPTLDVTTLVFLDETGARTQMTRTRGRAPKGARCIASVPHGPWQTTTFIAGWRGGEIPAPMVLDGPMDGEAFLTYVTTFLCPPRQAGDIVIADHRPRHPVAGVKEAIAATGARLRSLPPYSPDLNPLENLFSNLQALLKKAAPRSLGALWNDIGTLLDAFSSAECANSFKAAGYYA
jgi:transposase